MSEYIDGGVILGQQYEFRDMKARAAAAPTEETAIASSAHVPGTPSEYFFFSGILYKATESISVGGAIAPETNCEEVQNGLGGEIANVKSALDSDEDALARAPLLHDSSAENVDLDITDIEGHVLARLSGGHIKTKNFDSEYATEANARTMDTDAEETDLDFADTAGNVLARFTNGHIKTKKFDSEQIVQGIIPKWNGIKWTIIGDSLSEVNQRATKRYHDYIIERTGISIVNLAHSGAGYYYRASDYTFRKQALNVPVDSDVVTIFGGGNDIDRNMNIGDVTDTTADTLCGCVNITLDNLFETAPTVQVGVITPTPWYQSSTKNWTPGNPDNDMEQYVGKIIEICRRRGIPCLDLYHCSNLHPEDSGYRSAMYSRDEGGGVHPDENGHKLIAPRFQAFLDSLLLH